MRLREVLERHARVVETGPRAVLDVLALRDELESVRQRVNRDVGIRVGALALLFVAGTLAAASTGDARVVAGAALGATLVGFFVVWQLSRLAWERSTTDLLLLLSVSAEPDLLDTVITAVSRDLGPQRAEPEDPADIVVLTAREDRSHLTRLMTQLSPLERTGVSIVHRYRLRPGGDEAAELLQSLEQARMVVILVSPDLIGAKKPLPVLIARAAELCRKKGLGLVPVLVRPCMWSGEVYGQRTPLPGTGKPVTAWRDADAAWLDVAQGLHTVWQRLSAKRDRPSASG